MIQISVHPIILFDKLNVEGFVDEEQTQRSYTDLVAFLKHFLRLLDLLKGKVWFFLVSQYTIDLIPSLKHVSKSACVLQIGWRSAPETAAIVIGEEIAATICGYARSLRLKPQLDASAIS